LTKRLLAMAWDEEDPRQAVAHGYRRPRSNAAAASDAAHYQRTADRHRLQAMGDSRKTVAGAVAFLCMPASPMRRNGWSAVDGGFLAG